jgi:hypothetical protein
MWLVSATTDGRPLWWLEVIPYTQVHNPKATKMVISKCWWEFNVLSDHKFVSQSGSPPPPMHTPCLTDFALDFVFFAAPPLLVTRYYEHQKFDLLFCVILLDMMISWTAPHPTHLVLMIATNQNANCKLKMEEQNNLSVFGGKELKKHLC